MRQFLCTIFVGSTALAACGLNPQKNYQNLRPKLVRHDYDGANKYLEGVKKSFYSEKNRLLFYMDKAMVLSLGGRYEESNKYLEKAKLAAEELWTESIGEHAAAWATTDNSMSYQGQDFEKVMLHLLGSMNYIALGAYESARVEARQVTNKLQVLNQSYDSKKRSVYRDDAFARWLAGKLAETEGGFEALNGAWIDYKKAVEVYEKDYAKRYGVRLPPFVIEDALRVVEALGADFQDEYDALRAKYGTLQYLPQSERAQLGEVILIHFAGEAPYKRDNFWTAPVPDGVIRIAFPEFVPKPYRIRSADLVARPSGVRGRTVLAQDINAIAIQDLKDHLGRIRAKAISRSVAKYIASRGLREGGKQVAKGKSDSAKAVGVGMQVAGALFNIGSAIAEESDKRSWITLPASINIARVFLPPGEADIEVSFGRGKPMRYKVNVVAGATAFIRHRTYD